MQLIVVFDAYRVAGHPTEIFDYHNIHVVFTKEAETADQYIEKFAHTHASRYRVTVATSDGLEQVIIRGAGCGLLSAQDLRGRDGGAGNQIREKLAGAGDRRQEPGYGKSAGGRSGKQWGMMDKILFFWQSRSRKGGKKNRFFWQASCIVGSIAKEDGDNICFMKSIMKTGTEKKSMRLLRAFPTV